MNLSRKSSLTALAAVTLIIQAALPSHVLAASSRSGATQWSVQVDKVATGDVNIAPTFKIAIYENLLQELAKRKQFKQVLRSGDRNADGVPDLLILKTTVESFAEGSETRRAVTTISGATKLKVRSELSTREGQIVLERQFNGNVRFFGDNLRATHNLVRNVANAIQHSALPEPVDSVPTVSVPRKTRHRPQIARGCSPPAV
jgi:hypothetical protein